jgi:hypothetical protein
MNGGNGGGWIGWSISKNSDWCGCWTDVMGDTKGQLNHQNYQKIGNQMVGVKKWQFRRRSPNHGQNFDF